MRMFEILFKKYKIFTKSTCFRMNKGLRKCG